MERKIATGLTTALNTAKISPARSSVTRLPLNVIPGRVGLAVAERDRAQAHAIEDRDLLQPSAAGPQLVEVEPLVLGQRQLAPGHAVSRMLEAADRERAQGGLAEKVPAADRFVEAARQVERRREKLAGVGVLPSLEGLLQVAHRLRIARL
jgi:hypothetical protein